MRLSPLAKGAFMVALIGCGIALYGKQQGVQWAGVAGPILLFGGAIVYLIERMRSIAGKRRAPPREDP